MQDCASILITGRFKTQRCQAGGEIDWDDLMSTKPEEKGNGAGVIQKYQSGQEVWQKDVERYNMSTSFLFFSSITFAKVGSLTCNLDIKDFSLDMQGACGRG